MSGREGEEEKDEGEGEEVGAKAEEEIDVEEEEEDEGLFVNVGGSNGFTTALSSLCTGSGSVIMECFVDDS